MAPQAAPPPSAQPPSCRSACSRQRCSSWPPPGAAQRMPTSARSGCCSEATTCASRRPRRANAPLPPVPPAEAASPLPSKGWPAASAACRSGGESTEAASSPPTATKRSGTRSAGTSSLSRLDRLLHLERHLRPRRSARRRQAGGGGERGAHVRRLAALLAGPLPPMQHARAPAAAAEQQAAAGSQASTQQAAAQRT